MPFHIKKQSIIQSDVTVYYEGGNKWTQDYADRKQYSAKADADAKLVNPDGKNGGFSNATVVSE